MTVDAVTLLFALLAVACQVAVVAVAALWVGARVSPGAARQLDRVARQVGPQAHELALVVAAVATAGSLYLSEVADFPPCRLCWYQRAAMYPLVPVLAVALWRRWAGAWKVVLPVALVGASISTWHVVIERYPALESGACDPTNPCTLVWVRHLGYVTIPTMALSGFLLIAALVLLRRSAATRPLETP